MGREEIEPVEAPLTTMRLVGTPAWTSRRAYSMSSSTKRSMEPTPIQAGGRPATFSTRAGTAPRNRGRAGRNTERRAPGKAIGARGPYEAAYGGRRWTRAPGAVVELGIDEQLEDDGNFIAVARVNRKARCVAAAGALTAYGNSGAIDAELFCVGVNPFQRGVIVFKRAGIARLGSEPVIDQGPGRQRTETHHATASESVSTCRGPFDPAGGSWGRTFPERFEGVEARRGRGLANSNRDTGFSIGVLRTGYVVVHCSAAAVEEKSAQAS